MYTVFVITTSDGKIECASCREAWDWGIAYGMCTSAIQSAIDAKSIACPELPLLKELLREKIERRG